MKQGKVWGITEEVFNNGETLAIHRLNILAGAYCSEHVHAHKTNLFYIVRGRLEIQQWLPGREIPDVTVMGPGDITQVDVGVWHRFKALEAVECIETYCGRLIGDDIERRTEGGRG